MKDVESFRRIVSRSAPDTGACRRQRTLGAFEDYSYFQTDFRESHDLWDQAFRPIFE